jgi:hypothetical protein
MPQLLLYIFIAIISGTAPSQYPVNNITVTKDEGLFSHDSVLNIRLTGNIRSLLKDRGDDGQYHSLTISYADQNGETVTIPLRIKTRGNFRRQKSNCTYPPLLLNFVKKITKNTLFDGQDKMKLVMPCTNDEFIVREYLAYKLYNQVTEKSFRARLVRVSLFDDTKKKEEGNFYGMLLEEDDQMAKRNGMKIMDKKQIQPQAMEKESFLKMTVFEYMVGNCDWSIPYLHNTRIIAFDSMSIPYVVPYDFDHSGFVSAPYAYPPEVLNLSSTRERRYRGYCLSDFKEYTSTIEFYNRKKEEFYKIITDCPQANSRFVKSTISWLDEFYSTINHPKKLENDFSYPCKLQVDFIIKGLSDN